MERWQRALDAHITREPSEHAPCEECGENTRTDLWDDEAPVICYECANPNDPEVVQWKQWKLRKQAEEVVKAILGK